MIYTSGVYKSEDDTLEIAQTRKMTNICRMLHLEKGHKLLDIGRYSAHGCCVHL